MQGALHRAHRHRAGQAEGPKLKKRKTLQKKKVLKGERKWHKLRAGREQRIFLKLRPKARKRLKRRMHNHGRVGITIVAHMRSAAGTRTAKRRIVMRTYKKPPETYAAAADTRSVT